MRVHCPPPGFRFGMRGWLGLYFASAVREPAPPRHLGIDLLHLFVERRQHAAFVFDLGVECGVLRGARSFLRRFLLRASRASAGIHVGRIDAGLHPARDVGPDPQMRVVADPARRRCRERYFCGMRNSLVVPAKAEDRIAVDRRDLRDGVAKRISARSHDARGYGSRLRGDDAQDVARAGNGHSHRSPPATGP